MCIRGREAMKAIKQQSNGRLDITLYTNSVLGQDTALISQTIAGALETYFLADRSAGAEKRGLRHLWRRLRLSEL